MADSNPTNPSQAKPKNKSRQQRHKEAEKQTRKLAPNGRKQQKPNEHDPHMLKLNQTKGGARGDQSKEFEPRNKGATNILRKKYLEAQTRITKDPISPAQRNKLRRHQDLERSGRHENQGASNIFSKKNIQARNPENFQSPQGPKWLPERPKMADIDTTCTISMTINGRQDQRWRPVSLKILTKSLSLNLNNHRSDRCDRARAIGGPGEGGRGPGGK
ncbi:hypothetical protein CEXT_103251 [Caerostris extrusa]|uniref:Uncharacterized protein n=1 Tax=Caerostris extrusa TaxID=172846 RepID=A0AAV4X4K5_CAEEX|nr:hypothetical protein CEXT_103251 [Caerostris extrusa]